MKNIDKRQKRRKQTAECFTPAPLVNDMLDKLNEYGPESWEEGKTFCDPACGNGQMLIEVLKRKLSLEHDPEKVLETIYGTDIMKDNIKECRLRLLKVLKEAGVTIAEEQVKTVLNNIICTPFIKYTQGSLDYDFEFKKTAQKVTILGWVKGINEDKWLDKVDIS